MEQAFVTLLFSLSIIEIVAAIVATIVVKKYWHSKLKLLLPFFWIIVVVEIGGYFMRINHLNNAWLYNLLGIIWFSILFSIYYNIIERKLYKRLVIVFWVLFLMVLIFEWSIINSFSRLILSTYSWSIGNLLMPIAIFLLLTEYLNSEKVMYFKKDLIIWMSVILLIYHVSLIPLQSVFSLLPEITGGKPYILHILQLVMSIIMYSGFIIGFLICDPVRDHNSGRND